MVRRARAERARAPSKRTCALDECDRALPIGSTRRRLYCSDAHCSLAAVRRKRARIAASTPVLFTGAICPVDGRVFAVEMFARPRGRPRKYDCAVCREIAKQLRMNTAEAVLAQKTSARTRSPLP